MDVDRRVLINSAIWLVPILCFIIVSIFYLDIYIPIIISYIIFLVLLHQFADIEDFLLFRQLQDIWDIEANTVKQFIFQPADFAPPAVKTTPNVVLDTDDIYNISILKYLLGQTGIFIHNLRDQSAGLIGMNIGIAIFLMILTSQNSVGTGQLKVSDSEWVLVKFLISYFFVVLQMVWFCRIMYHYRHNNAKFYYEAVVSKGTILNRTIPAASDRAEDPQEAIDMLEKFVDFDFHIAPGGRVTVSSHEGEADAYILLQTAHKLQLTLRLIERGKTDAELLREFGKELYDWLFPSPIHTHFHQTEGSARANQAKVRIRMRIEEDNIASLPLEFIYRNAGNYFLSVNPATVFSRYLHLPLPPDRVRRREGPLHMLAIIANPNDQTPLVPDEWESLIQDALKQPLTSGQMRIQTVKNATRKEIRNALLAQKPDIIQFVGHGIYQNGRGYLALVDQNTGQTWLVDDEQFARLYLGHDDYLRLISLATCESAKSDSPQGFLGIAPQLVQRGIPAVVAMQYSVYVKTAEVFLEDFYASVAARKPVDWAVQSARNAISMEFGLDNREFATPVLYMRAKDGNIF